MYTWPFYVCVCPEENAHHQGHNMEAYQESREVWPSCQLLTFSVSAYICFPVHRSLSLPKFLSSFLPHTHTRYWYNMGYFQPRRIILSFFFGSDSMNWSILGHFWNKQNFTNVQLLKIKKLFTIAILSEPCLWIWKAGASCCLQLTLFTRDATWSLLLLFGSSFFPLKSCILCQTYVNIYSVASSKGMP